MALIFPNLKCGMAMRECPKTQKGSQLKGGEWEVPARRVLIEPFFGLGWPDTFGEKIKEMSSHKY